MKTIPLTSAACSDYPVGLLLAASPWMFGFADRGPATTIAVVLGLGALVYSLLTAYELGVAKIISFRVHLAIDFNLGPFSGRLALAL